MDTTAAAELGGGVIDGGGGLWESRAGAGEAEGWSAEKQQQGGGGGGGGGHNRASGSSTPNVEPPPKRTRNMNAGGGGGGGGDGYGSGSGNFSYSSPMGGFTPGASDSRSGFGPGSGQGGSPNVKNKFPQGGQSPGFPQGPPPAPLPPGTPTGDSQGQGMPRGRGMGSIFYKTKLCSRFRSGNCPYNTNCNFAHGMEELRRPPPGWEDAAGAMEGGGGIGGGTPGGGNGGGLGSGGVGIAGGSNRGGSGVPPGGANASVAPSNTPLPNQGVAQGSSQGPNEGPTQGSNQGPIQGPNQGPNPGPSPSPSQGGVDMQRFHKTRPCKKYFSEMGCPYGDRCNFLHDEPSPQMASKSGRESVVVTVVANGGGSGSGPAPSPSAGGVAGAGGTLNQRPPNWKTRLCNKWETTGNCPFGEKCHFAHGTAELQRYGGGPVDPSSLEAGALSQMDSRFGIHSSGNSFGDGDDSGPSYPDSYPQAGMMRQASGQSLQQTPRSNSGMGSKSSSIWKGPTSGISTIYGDWLDENEWMPVSQEKHGQLTPSAGQKGAEFSNEPLTRKEKDQQNSSPFLKPGSGSARIYCQG
ncbi:unnamed protein product [Calypogeia fissa]